MSDQPLICLAHKVPLPCRDCGGPLFTPSSPPPFPKYPGETLESMAEIGEAFMDAMPKGYSWCQSPAEIISDLQNERDDLVTALQGDIPEAPEIGPLSWLRSGIAELRKRKPAENDEDPSAYWEMVNELEAFHTKASAALANATSK